MPAQFHNILPADSDTLLTISSFGNLLYQARGLSQTAEVIGAASQLERTINGTLIDLSAPQFRKYSTKISAPDNSTAPPLDNVWPGMHITVECALVFCYLTSGGNGPHGRNPVSGSQYVEGGYTFYRPVLEMRVVTHEQHFDEWKNVIGWTLDAEEI